MLNAYAGIGVFGMTLFRFLFGVDLAAAAVALYFFLAGLADGSVSSFNMGIWLALLGGIAAVIAGGYALNRAGYSLLTNLVLAVLAAPACLYAAFVLMIVIAQPRWN